MQPEEIEQTLKTYRVADPPDTLDARIEHSLEAGHGAANAARPGFKRYRIAAAAAALLLVAAAILTNVVATRSHPAATAPSIAFEREEVPFGPLPPNEVVSKSIAVYNRGGTELQINEVKATCGCTLAKFHNLFVPPGGQTELEISINSAKVLHPYGSKKVVVHSNDPVRPEAVVSVTADSSPTVQPS